MSRGQTANQTRMITSRDWRDPLNFNNLEMSFHERQRNAYREILRIKSTSEVADEIG